MSSPCKCVRNLLLTRPAEILVINACDITNRKTVFTDSVIQNVIFEVFVFSLTILKKKSDDILWLTIQNYCQNY